MNTSPVNNTAALAMAAARRNVDNSKDVAKRPLWNSSDNKDAGKARTLINEGLTAIANSGSLPLAVQNYADQLRRGSTLQFSSSSSKVSGSISEAAHRLANLIPVVIASELNKISDHLNNRMISSNGDSTPKRAQPASIQKPSSEKTMPAQDMIKRSSPSPYDGTESSNIFG